MHVPDHFLSDPVSATTAVAAGAAVLGAAVRARRDRAHAPHPAMIGATTAAVFGLQMLNYPVGAGTSGHLMGGALAAALLGPAWGILSVTVVLAVQSLVFADGGLTALGTNTLLMAVVGTLVGWAVARGVVATVRRRTSDPDVRALAPAAAGVGGAAGVLAAALLFVGLYATGGTVDVPLGALAGQMLGVHLLIGAGEAVITGAVVAVVVAVRGSVDALAAPDGTPARAGGLAPAGVLTGIAALAALVLSGVASGAPDGLEATAERTGFAGAARDHALAGMPLADYGEVGGIVVGVAGAVGVVLCLVIATGLGAAWARARTEAVPAGA